MFITSSVKINLCILCLSFSSAQTYKFIHSGLLHPNVLPRCEVVAFVKRHEKPGGHALTGELALHPPAANAPAGTSILHLTCWPMYSAACLQSCRALLWNCD
jgi:hypothetical protein